MSTTIQDKGTGGGSFTPAPEGAHVGVCVGVVDLGTQRWDYNGEPKSAPKMMLLFELITDATKEDGDPFTVNEEFTSFFSEKANLRKFLESWRGKAFTEEERAGFNVGKLLGAPCFLNVVHGLSKKGRTFARVKSIMPLPKGMPKPSPTLAMIHYEIEHGRPGDEIPEWIRAKINNCEEFKNAPNPMAGAGHKVDPDLSDVPF